MSPTPARARSRYVAVPDLRICGMWLEAQGFCAGETVAVVCTSGLIISCLGSPVVTANELPDMSEATPDTSVEILDVPGNIPDVSEEVLDVSENISDTWE